MKKRRRAPASRLRQRQLTLLDLVDHLISKGVMLTGDVVLSVAEVDLVYLHLSLLVSAIDRVSLPPPAPP